MYLEEKINSILFAMLNRDVITYSI